VKPDERFDLTLVSQRVYGTRAEYLVIQPPQAWTLLNTRLKRRPWCCPRRPSCASCDGRPDSMATKSFEGVVKHIQRANREASDRYNYRAQSRATASGILNPTEVAGDYDMERLLYTTMGGELRLLRPDDLEKFRKKGNAAGQAVQGRHHGQTDH
jgi:hypothetical protein